MTTNPTGRAWRVYCISSGRPGNVPDMQARFAPDPITWVVPRAERWDYTAAGAHTVLPVDAPLPGCFQLTTQRQAALAHATADDTVCIQTDDDCKGFKAIPADGSKPRPAPWPEVRDALLAGLDGRAHLAGLPPTGNAGFATGRHRDYGFVLASIHAADTAAPGWDTTLPLKEDYDYTCSHLAAHGAIARLDMYVANYDHYSNRGGAVALRTPEQETGTAELLLARWPQYLRPHSRRPGELSFIPRRITKEARP